MVEDTKKLKEKQKRLTDSINREKLSEEKAIQVRKDADVDAKKAVDRKEKAEKEADRVEAVVVQKGKDLEVIKEDIGTATKERDDIEDIVQEARDASDGIISDARTSAKRITQGAEQTKNRLEGRIPILKTEVNYLGNKKTDVEKELSNAEEKISLLEDKADSLEKGIDTLEDREKVLNASVTTLGNEEKRTNERVTSAKVTLKDLKEDIVKQGVEKTAKSTELENIEKQRVIAQKEVDGLFAEKMKVADQKQGLHERELIIKAMYKKAGVSYNP